MSFCFGVAAGSSGARGARAVRARSALRRRRKPPEGAPASYGPVSSCPGAAAGSSGSRGARAVRARAASFAPQAQAPFILCVSGAFSRGGVYPKSNGSRGARAVRARAASFAPQAQAPFILCILGVFLRGGTKRPAAQTGSVFKTEYLSKRLRGMIRCAALIEKPPRERRLLCVRAVFVFGPVFARGGGSFSRGRAADFSRRAGCRSGRRGRSRPRRRATGTRR